MMRLRFLALFQGLLCLLATSTAAHDPSVEDEDYKLVMGVARKLFGQRGDAVAQKVQEEDVPLREPTVQGSEVPKFSAGEGDDQSGGSLPVGEGIWSPHTVKKNGGANENDALPLFLKPEIALKLEDPLIDQDAIGESSRKAEAAQQEALSHNDIQDNDHIQTQNGAEQSMAKEKEDGETIAEEVGGLVSAGDVKEMENTEGDNEKHIAGRDNGESGNEKETINIEEQDDRRNNPLLASLEFSHTVVGYQPVNDNEQEEEQRDSDNNEVGDYSDVAEHINNLGEDLLAISILAQRISELFFKDIPEGRRNNSLPGEDQTKYTEVLAKEEELQVANKEGVANEIASSEKKSMPDFGESKSVNDFPSLKSKAEDVGMADSEEEHERKKRSAGARIYFPGELQELQEEELRQEESSGEEFIEPLSGDSHTLGHNFDAEVNLEAEVVGNEVGEGASSHPPPDLGNDLGVNFPPRDSGIALEINPDAEIFDPELVSVEERTFRSGRRDK